MHGLIEYFVAEGRPKTRAILATTLLSELLRTEMDGNPLEDSVIMGAATLVLIAGIDTTWSAIGSSLWHLATHDDDRRQMVEDPSIMTVAIEELLRAYSPVTMARVVTEDVGLRRMPDEGRRQGDHEFPAANRDPEEFENPDEVILDRQHNRHVAFGSGIHRCAGSNLARMELRVAIEEWLKRIPDFHLAPGKEVTWAGGQVRGPGPCPWSSDEDPSRPRQMPGPCTVHRDRPQLFESDDYGLATVVGDGTVPAELEGAARLAIANCPEYAIEEISD